MDTNHDFFSFRRGRFYVPAIAGVALGAAIVASVAVLNARNGAEPAPASIATGQLAGSGFEIPAPTSLELLKEYSDIIVEGTIRKRRSQQDVFLTRSGPLGEQQVYHDIYVSIATYELVVERYVVGSGPNVIELQAGPTLEASAAIALSGTERRLWFLKEEKVYKLGGYSLYFGKNGILTEANGEVRFGGDRGGQVPFLAGKTLAQVADDVRSANAGP